MAGIINIAGSSGQNSSDTFYRYKMPQLLVKVEGKGNGIKTVIPNMADIARALARPATYPTKYFGCELGAQTTFDDKNERYIVNGAHDAGRLRELLATFIDKFVLCPSCKNPETDLYITKTQVIYRDCKACGHRQDVDMKHKLTTFILRNPPENKKKSKKSKGDKGGATGKDGATSPKAGDGGGDEEDDGALEAGSDDELTRKIEAGAADISVDDSKGDNEGWSVDTSAEAVKNRQRNLQAGVQGLLQSGSGAGGGGGDDDEDGEGENSPYSQFEAWVATEARDGSASDVDIYKKASELGIEKKYKTMQFLVQGLFTPTTIVSAEEVEKHAPLFKKMINLGGTAEKHLKSILGGIEVFVGLLNPEMATEKVVPRVLMAFYQADILDDEELLKTWASHVSKKYVDKQTCKKVRRSAAAFITWLDEEEDDSEEDSKDEADSA